jgi:hypothetical protein
LSFNRRRTCSDFTLMTSALASRSLRNKAIAVHTAELITEVATTG